MSHRVNRFVTVPFALFLFLIALATYGLAVTIRPDQILFTNDYPLSLAAADSLFYGYPALLGPPSHLGGRHLGPAYYWFLSILWGLSAFSPLSVVLLDGLTRFAAAAGVAMLARSLSGSSWAALAGLTIAFAGGTHLELIIPWHAYTLIVAQAFFLWTSVLWLKRGRSALLFHLLSSTVLLQMHLGGLPSIAATLVAIPMLRIMMQAPVLPTARIARAVAGGATAVLWLGPALYALSGRNPFLILLPNSRKVGHAGFGRVFDGFGELVSRMLVLGNTLVAVCVVVLLAVSLTAIVLERRRVSAWVPIPEVFAILLLLCSIVAAHLAALAFAPGKIHPYYFAPLIPVLWLFFGLFLGNGLSLLAPRIRQFGVVVCVLILVPWWHNGFLVFSYFLKHSPVAPIQTLKQALELSEFVKRERGSTDGPTALVTLGSGRLRQNGTYLLLGPDHYYLMQYAGSLKEMPSFVSRREVRMKHKTKLKPPLPAPTIKEGLLVYCSKKSEAHIPERERGYLHGKWQLLEPLSLEGCTTCAGCIAHRLAPIL